MGLDMYLEAEFTADNYSFSDAQEKAKFKKITNTMGIKDWFTAYDTNYLKITAVVLYWRKANAIHRWFIDNCSEDGKDDCKPMYVSVEELKQLRDTCKEVLADPATAEEKLPSSSGFFFGSTEYDEGYIGDLDHTIKGLDTILEKVEKAPGSAPGFYYRASW